MNKYIIRNLFCLKSHLTLIKAILDFGQTNILGIVILSKFNLNIFLILSFTVKLFLIKQLG
jgi:hypothetical protein